MQSGCERAKGDLNIDHSAYNALRSSSSQTQRLLNLSSLCNDFGVGAALLWI